MTDQTQKNKNRLINAIQNLKDCAFGMSASYMPFCYSYSNDTYNWDERKLDNFINGLVGYAPNCACYDTEFSRPLYLFFSLTIRFISAACNSNEQTFISLCKIAKLTQKSPGLKCAYEYLIEEDKNSISNFFDENAYWKEYHEFVYILDHINHSDFICTINYVLQEFIDNHSLSFFSDTNVINTMIMRINRTSSQITGEFRKRERLTEVADEY